MSRRTALLSLALIASVLAGCIHVTHSHEGPPAGPGYASRTGGPPPHAPAHGYRYKQRTNTGGVDLIFDSGVGAYVVVGWPDHYWHRDRFYRYTEGHWMQSRSLESGWADCAPTSVPAGLVEKQARARDKRGRWSYPAKHGY